MTKVLAFGTFDLLHPGHLSYLRQAKKFGNHLIVIIARDSTKLRQKKPLLFNEKERLQLIKSLKIVNQAFLGDKKDHFKLIKRLKPQVLCLGYDHRIKEARLKKIFPRIKTVRMKPYHPQKHKSTKLRNKLKRFKY